MRPVLDGPLPHAIAHRGSRLLWPENTMRAFRGAVELGYRWLETDLHITRDGVLVCLHDDTVDRTTDGSGFVWDLTFAELGRLDAGYRFEERSVRPRRGSGLTVPSFAELMAAFDDIRVIVDLKQDGLEAPLARAVEDLDLWDRLIVGSFSDERLRRFRDLTGGRVATSTGSSVTRSLWKRSWFGTPAPVADAIQVPVWYRGLPIVNARTVVGFHRGGFQVHVWTVNRAARMRRLLDAGVDGIITDRPDVLRDVLIERGRWTGA